MANTKEKELKETIAELEVMLQDGDLDADTKKIVKQGIEDAKAELEILQKSGEEIKEVETKAEKKAEDKVTKEIKEITDEIEKNKKILESEQDESIRELIEEDIKELTEKLEKSREKTEEILEKVEKKKAGRPKKEKVEKPKGKAGRPKKEKVEKPEPKKEEKKSEALIVVNGKSYNIEDCRQAILALKERKSQSKKTAKKYKTKKPATKAASNIETAIHQVGSAVTTKAEENPQRVIATFKEFKKKMNEAFTVLGKIISKQDVEMLRKSLKDIDDIIEKYK